MQWYTAYDFFFLLCKQLVNLRNAVHKHLHVHIAIWLKYVSATNYFKTYIIIL